jgi:hypothetical protein
VSTPHSQNRHKCVHKCFGFIRTYVLYCLYICLWRRCVALLSLFFTQSQVLSPQSFLLSLHSELGTKNSELSLSHRGGSFPCSRCNGDDWHSGGSLPYCRCKCRHSVALLVLPAPQSSPSSAIVPCSRPPTRRLFRHSARGIETAPPPCLTLYFLLSPYRLPKKNSPYVGTRRASSEIENPAHSILVLY